MSQIDFGGQFSSRRDVRLNLSEVRLTTAWLKHPTVYIIPSVYLNVLLEYVIIVIVCIGVYILSLQP